MTNLVINTQTISQHNGLFSLNDLHKSAGNEKKHQPALFLRNDQTKDLIAEIESENQIAYNTINGGKNRGTYVCRELVYAYAMWISAKFHLMVIRAFDAMNTGAVPCLDHPVISTEQAYQLQKAIKSKCQANKGHYQTLYHAIYDEFGVKSYKDLLASDFERALAFVASHQFNSDHNALWRLIGILEYHRMDDELRQLSQTLDIAQRQLDQLMRNSGLLYDAFGEMRLPSKNPNLVSEAKAFIDKQREMKRKYGLI